METAFYGSGLKVKEMETTITIFMWIAVRLHSVLPCYPELSCGLGLGFAKPVATQEKR